MSLRVRRGSELLGYLAAVGAVACISQTSAPDMGFGNGGAGVVAAGSGGDTSAAPAFGGAAGLASVEPGPMLTIPKNTGGAPGGEGTSGTGGAEATGGRTVTENCANTKASATDIMTVRPADIIFAIDSSSSMDQEIEFVQTSMNAFSQQISASGIDVRVILLAEPGAVCIDAPLGSGQCPADTKLPNYVHVPTDIGSRDALTKIVSSFPMWREHLRPGATKSFVVITDDDASNTPQRPMNPMDPMNPAPTTPQPAPGQVFTDALAALDPMLFAEWTFNGVYCFKECAPQSANVGTVYAELVAKTMGVGGDLCLQDFQPVFDRLAKQIITTSGSTIACEWELPPAPVGQSFSRELVKVDRTTSTGATPLTQVPTQAECASGGWHFDSELNPTRILACPNTCMDMQNQSGGKIDVTFGCEAVGGCVPSGAATVNSTTLASCQWDIPMPPQGQVIDYKSVNVRYTSPSGFASKLGNVPSAAECGMVQNGWYYDAPTNPKKILACPQTCTQVQAAAAMAKVEVLFGCDTLPAAVR